VYDAATLGFEIIWPYANCTVTKKSLKFPHGTPHRILSKDLFAINFPSHIRVKESYNLMIFPHHTAFFAMSSWSTHNIPIAIPQLVEADWWPGPLQVMFVRRKTTFEKGKPIAQGLVLPKQGVSLKEMSEEDRKRMCDSWSHISCNKDKYATRQVQVDGFSEQDNVYARLSQLNRSGNLPSQIKEKKIEPSLRLSWK
jgi:hypothetical protein